VIGQILIRDIRVPIKEVVSGGQEKTLPELKPDINRRPANQIGSALVLT